MKKVLLILIILMCLLVLPINAFAVTYGKTGESTNFDGDVGVPAGKGYYINDVLLSITDLTTYSTTLKIGRDADNLIDFTTDNKIVFRFNGADKIEMLSTGELDMNVGTVGFTLQTIQADDGTTTIDWRLGNKVQFTHYAGDETFTFTAPTNPCHLWLEIIQDGTGGRDCTWPAPVKWWGTEPTWADGGGGKTIGVAIWYNGTDYWAQGTPWES